MLKGVSAARRKFRKPPAVTALRRRASPAWAPRASPPSWLRDDGVQTVVEKVMEFRRYASSVRQIELLADTDPALPPIDGDFHRRWPIDVSVEAPYHGLVSFLDQIGGIGRLVIPGDLEVVATQEGSRITATLILTTYLKSQSESDAPPG